MHLLNSNPPMAWGDRRAQRYTARKLRARTRHTEVDRLKCHNRPPRSASRHTDSAWPRLRSTECSQPGDYSFLLLASDTRKHRKGKDLRRHALGYRQASIAIAPVPIALL